MAEPTLAEQPSPPAIAIVGLACRFPDANDAPELLDVVLTGRRAFRRIPPARLDIADYYRPGRTSSDATYSTRAALIEGWRFDHDAFGVTKSGYLAADPALWLALETAARALSGAGLTGGTGIKRDRTGVIVGNSLGGDTSRANALRVRWPFVRRVLTDAMAGEVPAEIAALILRRAERRYLSPFPMLTPDTLAGSIPGSIASAIARHFSFRGGSHAVDSACSSSLQAVASACSAIAAGELDAAIAGGVDISIDPLELLGRANTGVLATGEVRIYDDDPTGYLPAEGCGMVVLMRTADARSAGLPVYAEIVGWGASAGGSPREAASGLSSQLLAMRRAYERAALDPAEVQLFEGNGAGTKEDDEAELIALEVLRAGARHDAVLGSVKANIGHANAAAGVAGLIKTVLSLSTGVLPPATGVARPHALISGGAARLSLPSSARKWPSGTRLAGVSTLDSSGSNVHLVLRTEPSAPYRKERLARLRGLPAQSLDGDEVAPRLMAAHGEPVAFLVRAADRRALAAVLSRIADIACWLSDAELQDLACALAREPDQRGKSRVGIVATGQDQLAALAKQAAQLIPDVADGLLTVRPGIFAAHDADGRVTLLLSGESAASNGNLTDSVAHCLDAVRWLGSLEVHATGAVGHGLGALAGLAWAGVLGEGDVAEIAKLRAQFLDRSDADADTPQGETAEEATAEPAAPAAGAAKSAELRTAIAQKFRLGPPRRRLFSTMTGSAVDSVDAAIDLICTGFSGDEKLAEAIGAGAVGATLMLETGPGSALTTVAADSAKVPAISLDTGPADPASSATAAAALFAAGALDQPQPLFAGLPARPIDIWRERVFISSPCELRPKLAPAPEAATMVPAQRSAAESASEQAMPDVALDQPKAESDVAPADLKSEPAPEHVEEDAAAEQAAVEVAEVEMAEVEGPEVKLAVSKQAQAKQAQAKQAQSEQAQPEQAQPEHAELEQAELEQAQLEQAQLEQARPEQAEREQAQPESAMAAASATEIAPADVDAEPIAGEATESSQEAASIGAWASCFGEALKPSDYPTRTGRDVSWRAVVAGPRAVRTAALRTYRAESAARRTLAVLGDPADENSRAAALQAARDAITTKCLVVLTTSPDFTGFFASLQAEHPDIGVTVLRIPVTENAPKLASRYAYTEPGTFRELVIAPDGSIYEPVMDDMKLTQGGAFPLRSEDVVLVSRGTRGAGLALAQVLACCGTPVAVVGRATEGDDSALVAGLEQLRSAGARIGYEIIDIANPASLAAAIERVEARLGPVAAIGHAAGSGDHVPLMNLTDAEISDHIAGEAATLDRLVGSVRPDQLRMIVTFGSVAGRYGQAGGTMLALGSGALAARAANLAAGTPDCRSLHVDMPTWSGGGPGDLPQLAEQIEDSGTTPIDLGVAARLLLKIMTTPGLPDRLAVHGRVSGPAAKTPDVLGAADLAAAGLDDGARFLQEVKAHYPGLELVCEARLSMQTDPYLADYRVDGLPVLPPVLALEALAQAASVVAGRPAREARNVRLESPIVVPAGGEAELRVSAQRTGDTITAVLRCSESSFAVDHARAEFPCAATQAEMPRAELAKAPAAMSKITSSSSGLVDGAELYGPISFQSGRFRRVALLPEVTARSCRALARGDDRKPWFAPDSDLAHSEFVLGSPGMNDATLHAVQACVPHRRIRPAGCESVVFSGRIAEGPVEIRAVAERGDGTESEAHTAVPETEMMALVEAVATTPDEDADQQLAASRPQGRRGRRSRKQLAGQQRHPVAASITKARAATARAQKGRSGQNGAPHEEAPHEEAPHEDAPHEDAPHEEAPHEEAPHEKVHRFSDVTHATFLPDSPVL